MCSNLTSHAGSRPFVVNVVQTLLRYCPPNPINLEACMTTEPQAGRQCPYCKEEIKAEAIKCKHCGSGVTPERPAHQGTCPFCKEQINPEAIKCKHCKSVLNSDGRTSDCGCDRSGQGGVARPVMLGNSGALLQLAPDQLQFDPAGLGGTLRIVDVSGVVHDLQRGRVPYVPIFCRFVCTRRPWGIITCTQVCEIVVRGPAPEA